MNDFLIEPLIFGLPLPALLLIYVCVLLTIVLFAHWHLRRAASSRGYLIATRFYYTIALIWPISLPVLLVCVILAGIAKAGYQIGRSTGGGR